MKNSMLGLFFNLFNDFDHDESRTSIFVLFLFQIHELSQSYWSFVFWWFLAFSWGWAFSWWCIILSALYATWTDILSLNRWLVSFDSCEFSVLWWVSFSFFGSLNNLTCLFHCGSKHRSSVCCADHFGFLLLENFNLFSVGF